ncbi:MAG TPA: hypothetical protein VFL19_00505 [Nitrospira sp.]|nr:hypothetical protein [Nitrospira sp.]
MATLSTRATLVCFALFAVLGCRGGAPVYEVKNAPVQTATGKEVTADQVQRVIIESGAKLGWIMALTKPGELQGTLNLRSHTAVVTIPFSSKGYSILYKDSTNLKYDADKLTIHGNYNGWVQRLDNEIRARMATLSL